MDFLKFNYLFIYSNYFIDLLTFDLKTVFDKRLKY